MFHCNVLLFSSFPPHLPRLISAASKWTWLSCLDKRQKKWKLMEESIRERHSQNVGWWVGAMKSSPVVASNLAAGAVWSKVICESGISSLCNSAPVNWLFDKKSPGTETGKAFWKKKKEPLLLVIKDGDHLSWTDSVNKEQLFEL